MQIAGRTADWHIGCRRLLLQRLAKFAAEPSDLRLLASRGRIGTRQASSAPSGVSVPLTSREHAIWRLATPPLDRVWLPALERLFKPPTGYDASRWKRLVRVL